jgi:hypothetical protein
MAAPRPGCRLTVKRDDDLESSAKSELARLRLSREGSIIYCTYVDSLGMSIYAKRGGAFMADIEGFIEHGGFENWMTYFEVGAIGEVSEVSPQYSASRHVARTQFPYECV